MRWVCTNTLTFNSCKQLCSFLCVTYKSTVNNQTVLKTSDIVAYMKRWWTYCLLAITWGQFLWHCVVALEIHCKLAMWINFVCLGFYVAFNTVQVISRRVVGRAEETSTYSLLGFCTVNCRPTASNYQLSHLRPWRGSNPGPEVGGESVTTLPPWPQQCG